MKKYFALLAYRVARYLAPEYFANRLQSLNEMRVRLNVLRLRLCNMSRRSLNGFEGQHIAAEVRSLEAIYKSVAEYENKYELMKIEIRNQPLPKTVKGDKEQLQRDLNKRRLFEAMAGGLAESAEVEKFMYSRKHGKIDVVGIEIYLKHNDK